MDRKLLILDLDETLIFGTIPPLETPADCRVGGYHGYERPFVREFIASCAAAFRLAVWTSATEAYAAGVVDHLFGARAELDFVWARERCTLQFDHHDFAYRHTKNIKKVKKLGYDLERIIVVDNTAAKWTRSYGNLVLASDYEGDPEDNELQLMGVYLQSLKSVSNVLSIEKRGWRGRFDGGHR
ncbi:MAG: HAD family hydrolase [bacterium]|nr:HAD family hydrolase [bacterium]